MAKTILQQPAIWSVAFLVSRISASFLGVNAQSNTDMATGYRPLFRA